MLTIPAVVWRGGFVSRAVIVGGTVGLCLGGLAWIDSGFLLSGVIVLVVVGTVYGIWMARRMAHYWPGARTLSGQQRVAVAGSARRGQAIDDTALAQSVIDYREGLYAASEQARWMRLLLGFVLVIAAGTAGWDAVYGSWGAAVASSIYFVALVIEMFWMPRRQRQLLANADRAAAAAQSAIPRS
ncbi:MAG: hypothetical protein AB7G47_17415 [Mycolicibacterium sp.]|uniref:hypothetical protein n=1 Tax=Mycolicibacterium sp. TaxID=2320850 RepID=UPI003D0DD4E5